MYQMKVVRKNITVYKCQLADYIMDIWGKDIAFKLYLLKAEFLWSSYIVMKGYWLLEGRILLHMFP